MFSVGCGEKLIIYKGLAKSKLLCMLQLHTKIYIHHNGEWLFHATENQGMQQKHKSNLQLQN